MNSQIFQAITSVQLVLQHFLISLQDFLLLLYSRTGWGCEVHIFLLKYTLFYKQHGILFSTRVEQELLLKSMKIYENRCVVKIKLMKKSWRRQKHLFIRTGYFASSVKIDTKAVF